MDEILHKIDGMGKPAWIGLMVLSFVLFWPIGLALLAYLIWSGRMGHRNRYGAGRWRFESGDDTNNSPSKHKSWSHGCGRSRRSSGNSAFDEYRAETLNRLEQEQQEFLSFLERLRFAKDKSEFDQFLSERRHAPDIAEPQSQV